MLATQVALFIGNYASLEVMSDSLLTAILVWLSRCLVTKRSIHSLCNERHSREGVLATVQSRNHLLPTTLILKTGPCHVA